MADGSGYDPLAALEREVRRLLLTAVGDQPAVDLLAVAPRPLVVEAEPAERVDPVPPPRDAQPGPDPPGLGLAVDPEVELVIRVVRRSRVLRQEEPKPLAVARASI